MEFLGEAAPTQEPKDGVTQGPAKVRAVARGDCTFSDKDLLLVSKLALAGYQLSARLADVLFITLHVPIDSAPIKQMEKAGKKYHEMTKGNKNHGQGIPAWWLWCALVCGCLEGYDTSPQAADVKN